MSRSPIKKRPVKFIILSLLCVSICILYQFMHVEAKNPKKIIIYTVSYGETLWDIAKAYTKDSEDVRKTIYEIRELNKIDPTIYPGQEIKIPLE